MAAPSVVAASSPSWLGNPERRLALLAVAAVAVPSLLAAPVLRAVPRALGLTGAAVPLSTIQLDQHAQLWSVVTPTGWAKFSFTVDDTSAQAVDYRWAVTLATGNGAPVRADGGSFSLLGSHARTVPVAVHVDDCTQRTEVVVTLTPGVAEAPDERLSFWVEPSTAPADQRDGRPTCGGSS